MGDSLFSYNKRTFDDLLVTLKHTTTIMKSKKYNCPRNIKKIVNGKKRRGKWSQTEQDYSSVLIEAFRSGILPDKWIDSDTTLRIFLATRLWCNEMRITKHFTGPKKIGKQLYYPTEKKNSSTLQTWLQNTKLAMLKDIKKKEQSFLKELEKTLRNQRIQKQQHTKCLKRQIKENDVSTFMSFINGI